jgi:RNA polymerase sigma factor (sigma-70 family)
MPSPLDDWDLGRYRTILRERAARLHRDPRVRVRFDESDLTNETLRNALKAKQVPEGLTDDARRLAWLAAIQDRTLIDLYRKQFAAKRDVRRERDLQSLQRALHDSSVVEAQLALDPSAGPVPQAERREDERLTDEAIARLDSPQREVLRLRREGRSFEEIGAGLDMTAAAAAGHYYRGLKKLREQLGGA